MQTRALFPVIATLFAALAFSTPAAAVSVFLNRDAFLAALTNSYTENFADITTTRTGVTDAPQNFDGNGMSFSVNTQPTSNDLYTIVNGGTKWLTVNNPANSLVFSLTSGNITAIGGNFFLTDQAGDFLAGSIDILISGPDVDVGSGLSYSIPDVFVGYIFDTPITSMTVSRPAENNFNWITAGYITVGQVPEPSTYALLAMSAAGALWWARRRR
jgi:hypothetical protein